MAFQAKKTMAAKMISFTKRIAGDCKPDVAAQLFYTLVMNDSRLRGAGGTEGGIGTFLVGFVMAVAGGWLLANQVTVTSGFWRFGGYNAFGLSLLPLVIGIGILFFNGRSIPGWLLTIAGATIIVAGILTNLEIYFRPTSLFNTLIMLALLAGGIGLVAKSLRGPAPRSID